MRKTVSPISMRAAAAAVGCRLGGGQEVLTDSVRFPARHGFDLTSVTSRRVQRPNEQGIPSRQTLWNRTPVASSLLNRRPDSITALAVSSMRRLVPLMTLNESGLLELDQAMRTADGGQLM